jgi:hypothetical protein
VGSTKTPFGKGSKNGQLWNLLKSWDEGKPNDTVFKGKTGKIINRVHLSQFWHGSKGNGILVWLPH